MKKIYLLMTALLAVMGMSAKNYVVTSSADWANIVADTKNGNEITVKMTLSADDLTQLKTVSTTMLTKLLDLTDAVFPNDVMPENMFALDGYTECKNLVRVVMPKTLKSTGAYAFRMQTKLVDVIFPGNSQFEYFGEGALQDCKSLSFVKVPASIKSIKADTFSGMSRTFELTTMVFAQGSQLETIEENGFHNAYYTSALSLPGSLKTIANNAFRCEKYEHLLMDLTFEDGEGELTIGENAFADAKMLYTLNIVRREVPKVSASAFAEEVYEKCHLRVPADMIEAYKADPVFGKFANIEVYVAPAPRQKAAVYITAGQSNAEGRTDCKYLSEEFRSYRYKHLKYQQLMKGAKTTFTTKSLSSGGFCFTDICNVYLDRDAEDDFYSMNGARGGTPIEAHSDNGNYKGPAWSCDPEWLADKEPFDSNFNSSGESLSKGLFQGFKTLAMNTLFHLEQGYEVKAFFWHQGENDWHDGSKYYNNLKTLIQYFRDQLYEITGDESAKTVPFITGTVARKNGMYSKQVEQATFQVAEEDPYTYVIDCGDFPVKSMETDGLNDTLHFSSPSVEAIGKLFYEKLVEIGADVKPTGIHEVTYHQRPAKSDNVYNLAGQRVNKATKGIIIKDGKKYVAY